MSRRGGHLVPSSSAIKDGAKRLARRAGLDVRRHQPRSSFDACRSRLLQDLAVDVVLDVGANRGQYGAALRSGGYRRRIVSFEPLAEPFADLARRAAGDRGWDARQVALGERSGRATMNVSAASASSSLLPAADARFDVPPHTRFVGTEQVDVARLDDLAPALVSDHEVVYLKADVQGYELAVLDGAGALLPRLRAIELELSLVPLYEGQPLWREVLDVVEQAGLAAFTLAPAFADRTTGRLLQLDAICTRDA